MECPICFTTMTPQESYGVTFEVCQDHGVWLDHGKLFQLNEARRHAEGRFTLGDLVRWPKRPPAHEGRVLGCPRCKKDMRTERYQDVNLDWCPQDGVWLDAGELEAIQNNLRLDHAFLDGIALRLDELRY